MSNGRKVSTDALETLGTIIDDTQRRDAIHLAVEPVIAGEILFPGDRITVANGVAMGAEEGKELGIVDPFLADCARQGQRFWFVMNPRMVTSLRHVWSHPSFPDAEAPASPDKARSEKWLRDFCDRSDCPPYEKLVAIALENDNDTFLHVSGEDAHGDIPPELWDHVEIVTGRKCPKRPTFFTCSC